MAFKLIFIVVAVILILWFLNKSLGGRRRDR